MTGLTRRSFGAPVLAFLFTAGSATAQATPASPVAVSPIDVRAEATALLLDGKAVEALARLDKARAANPSAAQALGLDYFRGRILERLERNRDAAEAFAEVLSSGPSPLRAHSRYHLALAQSKLRHPEVAAGLIATLLGNSPPPELISPSIRLLRDSLERGGDCRVATPSLGRSFAHEARRRLELLRTECARRGGAVGPAEAAFLNLLRADTEDETALEAAEHYTRLVAVPPAEVHRLLGMAFHQHREFDRATEYLQSFVSQGGDGDIESRYALERSRFWLSRFPAAATGFGRLLEVVHEPARRSQILYQQARSLELSGDLASANAAFRASHATDPRGENAGAALLSALRVEHGLGNGAATLALFDQLTSQPSWRSAAARAALFLSSTDLVRGRGDRAGAWLESARRAGAEAEEIAYWRGRLFEIQQRNEAAVRSYAEAILAEPWSPWAQSAERRLRGPALAASAQAAAQRWSSGPTLLERNLAWAAFGEQDERGQRVRLALLRTLAADPTLAPFLGTRLIPPSEWPLWSRDLQRTDEMLIALGGWGEGASALGRHFPLDSPSLGLTGADLAARDGATRRSLVTVESLRKRVPARLPLRLLPKAFLTGLYPLPYREIFEQEAKRRAVDPALIAAIVREESRFDPLAVSAASARGLAQFVLSTAKDLGLRHELGALGPRDLEKPSTALALAAVYLQELSKRSGSVEQAVASYNAGEPQAALWRKYCVSSEPEEYLSKVSFKETRAYVARVLTSRNAYQEIWFSDPKSASNDALGGRTAPRVP